MDRVEDGLTRTVTKNSRWLTVLGSSLRVTIHWSVETLGLKQIPWRESESSYVLPTTGDPVPRT